MEKDLYQGRRRDPRKPRGLDKTAKAISPKEMTDKAVGVLNKSFDEAKDPREYGFEGEMAMSQLKGIMQHAESLHGMLKPDTDLPEWVQSKITLAYDYIQTAADYMSSEMNEEVNIDAYADSLIKRDKQNLRKDHVVHAARVAGVDHKKLLAAVQQKVGRLKEEAPTNAAGGGSIDGIGVGARGEPGVRKTKYQKKNAAEAPKSPVMDGMVRRKMPSFKQFMG